MNINGVLFGVCRLVKEKLQSSPSDKVKFQWHRLIRGRYYRHLMLESWSFSHSHLSDNGAVNNSKITFLWLSWTLAILLISMLVAYISHNLVIVVHAVTTIATSATHIMQDSALSNCGSISQTLIVICTPVHEGVWKWAYEWVFESNK